jgi:hypothetical protein
MGPVGHGLVALGVGAAVWAATGSKKAVPAAVATGVLNDTDHLYDFYRWYVKEEPDREHVYLWFHAWEYSLSALLLIPSVRRNPVLLAGALGHLSHMFGDHFANKPNHPLSYSVLYRASQGFRHDALFEGEVDDLNQIMDHNIPLWKYIEPVLKPFVPWL